MYRIVGVDVCIGLVWMYRVGVGVWMYRIVGVGMYRVVGMYRIGVDV
jgi:hypothetical protein